jgi:hypothetical protein
MTVMARKAGVRLPGGEIFLSFTVSRLIPGRTQPAIQLVPGVKRPGRETDHSFLSSAEV